LLFAALRYLHNLLHLGVRALGLRGWGLVIAAAIGLALVSLASNVTTNSQALGGADTLLVLRSTISKLVNAGTVWAGLAVLSGWLVRRPARAVVAGIVACLLALGVHYGVGQLLGLFDAEGFTENSYWFAVAVIVGGPLGLIGSIARRRDQWGVAARLSVPLGAIVEPIYLDMFTRPPIFPWTVRASSAATGVLLLTIGTAGCVAVLVTARRQFLRGGAQD
jgi:hypothetical protein